MKLYDFNIKNYNKDVEDLQKNWSRRLFLLRPRSHMTIEIHGMKTVKSQKKA